MTSERWKRLKAIFTGALEQPEPQRANWVVRACEGDETLLSEVRKLLHAHETNDGFLDALPPLNDDPDALPDGTQLGSYRIVRELGRGGMGIVYLARDLRLKRDVALKTVRPIFVADPQLRQRLEREAQAAAAVKHEGIATVHSLEELNEHLVIISEYIAGETLRNIIAVEPLALSRAEPIAVQIAAALAAAHEAGVVHRDLKPENVIVTSGDKIKVVDFGIAFVDSPDLTTLTRTGVAIGTPRYMAPEQLAGEAVDARADVYAFGVLLHEMLTGRHPLTTGIPVSDSRIAEIIARCVRHNPDERFPSGRELVGALTGAAGPTATSDTRDASRPARWWWEFHQVMVAVVYSVTVWPAWLARQIVGGVTGRALFLCTLAAVIVASILRLNLWFNSRFSPGELRWARRRAKVWIKGADWLFVASLAASGLLVGEDRSPVALILIAIAVGASVAFLMIERATARAAFLTRDAKRPKDTKNSHT